jgi:type II secretory pathway pseudopilin PulG
MKAFGQRASRAFTLLEVMIAIAFIGIAMIALMGLHRQDLESVIRAQDLTRAAMLAQMIMTQAEMERFPSPGETRGDFSRQYPGQYVNFRWERTVDPLPNFPDVCRVRVRVFYGSNFHLNFGLAEFLHNPNPPRELLRGGEQEPEEPPDQE